MDIGAEIKKVAESKKLSQKEVGDLIGDKQQNVGNDYKKESLTFNRMLLYSQGLDHNFFQYYNNEEPYKTYREEEFQKYQTQIKELTRQLNDLNNLLAAKEETVVYQTHLVKMQMEMINKLKGE